MGVRGNCSALELHVAIINSVVTLIYAKITAGAFHNFYISGCGVLLKLFHKYLFLSDLGGVNIYRTL